LNDGAGVIGLDMHCRAGPKYGLSDVREGMSVIRDSVWSCFVQKVQL